MIKDIRLETSSQESPRADNLESLLQKLAIQVKKKQQQSLRSAQSVLDEDLISSLHKKYQEVASKNKSSINFIEFMIYSLLNYINKLQQAFEIDVVKEDYQILEEAVQKSEAQVRNHIRIEQQLKIYLDSLQEKVEDLEKKLQIQEQKYHQLFESLKQSQEEKKELQRKIIKMEELRPTKADEGNDKNKFSTINDQLYKDYFGTRKTKTKGRHVIDKIHQRSKIASNQKSGGNLHYGDGRIHINLNNNIVVSKKNSYDQPLNKGSYANSHNSSIRELTKTVSMKPSGSQLDHRPKRKTSKYKTETNELEKREKRSSSVCN